MHKFYAHLISDSTGGTVSAVARAVFTRFNDVKVKYYTWALIGTERQLERIVNIAKKKTGIIVYTISDPQLLLFLKEKSNKAGIECIDAIEEVTKKVARYLHQKPTLEAGRLHTLDEQYFKRIDAINFTIMHDDGQSPESLKESEIILIGPSRTSKSPTAMYLAHKGFKVANIPFVSGIKLGVERDKLADVFFIGLCTSVDRLIDVRRNRLLSLNARDNTKYVSEEGVGNEIREAKKFYLEHNIPLIDVTNKSIEETAAKILQLYHLWKSRRVGAGGHK
jgi:[pyruvate, water dikinase]-phosphate phosphotransferase / [pyruvate, water dikinase] kinase